MNNFLPFSCHTEFMKNSTKLACNIIQEQIMFPSGVHRIMSCRNGYHVLFMACQPAHIALSHHALIWFPGDKYVDQWFLNRMWLTGCICCDLTG